MEEKEGKLFVHIEESTSAAGDCVWDAKTGKFLGYTEFGSHLDCDPQYKRFTNPPQIEEV